MTIREAVAIALEAVPGTPEEWLSTSADRKALRDHVRAWVHDYAKARGVILSNRDIDSEFNIVIAELRRAVREGV